MIVLLAQAAASQQANEGEAVVLMIVGMGVVFSALAILLGMIALINRFSRPGTRQVEQVTAQEQPSHPMDAVDPEFIAVLTAAATAALDRPLRIKRVRFVGRVNSTWASMGRQGIMSSHNPVRRHP